MKPIEFNEQNVVYGKDKPEYKYTDKNHPPVPLLKVGDICYARWAYGGAANYSHVSKCAIRKVEVRWYEPSEYDKEQGEYGYWYINYYIRTDINYPGLKSTKMYPYHTGEEGGEIKNLYLTPQEVMEKNVADFMKMVKDTAGEIRKTMLSLGYSAEKIKGLLE